MGDEQIERTRPAFTIIELLVVIGIIALLIGILLPALMRARTQAKDLACTSNVRQITQALQIYATENNGLLPPAMDNNRVPWQAKLFPILFHTTPQNASDPTYSYVTNTIFECPQAAISRNVQGPQGGYSETNHLMNGYALNSDIPGMSGETGMNAPQSYAIIRRLECKRPYKCLCPSATMILTDSQGYYVEYYNRGSALNSMDAGFSFQGGMLGALGRHGRLRDPGI